MIHIDRIENVQKKCLHFLNYKFVNNVLSLISLEKRSALLYMVSLFKIINNIVDNPKMLNSLNFRIPSYIRNHELLRIILIIHPLTGFV